VQLVRYADGSGWSLGMVVSDGGVVMSIAAGLRRLRQRGRLNGLSEQFLDVIASDGRALLSCWPGIRGALELAIELDDGSAVVPEPLSRLLVGPLVPGPEKVLGVSYNYGSFASQEGIEEATEPVVFAKAPSSVAGASDVIHVPPRVGNVDFEAEVGVVIGAVTRNADVSTARACIGGYTVINDMTAKILPRPAIDLATIVVSLKAIDGFAPVGAVVVTPDEVGDLSGISVVCRVNGEQRQSFAATGWVHSPAEVVSYLSGFMTLQPGDLITMGTSSGIGIAEVPPRLLQDGDVVQAELSGYPGTSNAIRFTGR
jgi:acylpyruvate hydrolase